MPWVIVYCSIAPWKPALILGGVVAKDCTFSALLVTGKNPTRCVGLLTALRFQRADGVCYSCEFVHTLVGRAVECCRLYYLHVARSAAWGRVARMKSEPKASRCCDCAYNICFWWREPSFYNGGKDYTRELFQCDASVIFACFALEL